ncbi:UNVERIFIED_ORG: PII-like signaling protein [Xanthobacter viscosus]|uniref:DUF190 domain-containing protein n=1 Tax=Xanthobacter autotrophicus TaxID=280 RepID=A0A6C1KAU4_XANAU|nr:DUF190 domain-containing protein [Xanthobacter autotrophicus]TLX41388.1 DUF190 domain-containing protein [Xanthobacter autotrophicus]
MEGFQIIFYTQQDRMLGLVPLAQWLFDEAKRHAIRGATMTSSLRGLGHDGATHAAGWFDLSDQPVQVTMIVTPDECERMLEYLRQEHVKVFYMKVPVEFGILGADM